MSGQLVSSFHCPIHKIEVYELPGKCQHCNSKLVESINYNTLMAYLYVTVSLYKLGEPEAFERLLEIAMKPYGWVAFDEIARANPRQAIAFLESFKTSKNKHIRAHATISLAQQEEKYVQVTTQYLASDDQSVRSSVLAYLAEKRDPRLKHVLQETYEKKGIPFSEKISAARGLILLGEKKPLNQLIMVLDNTDASQYHRLVLLELGYVGKMEHLPILERIIEKKPNDRLWAVSAVIKILKRYTEQLTEDTSAN